MRQDIIQHVLVLLVACLIASCSQEKKSYDEPLKALIAQHGLDQPFAADSVAPSEALAALGGELFFSPDLSIDGSVACASCHHPTKAGGDGIALPVGIGGVDSKNVGQDRVEAAQRENPELVGFVPRNSPSVFNAALFQKRLFWDGRVQYQIDPNDPEKKKIISGMGAAQQNPSAYLQENLLQTQARMPMTSSFEMKGGLKPNSNTHEIEQDILHFLQSQKRWCLAFAKVFGIQSCDQNITLNHLTQALAAFQATLVFTDSPFQRYVEGDQAALNEQQKRGAISFLTPIDQGGVGCVNCHSGKSFTGEGFYNINIPPSGRGANENGWDLGRHNVDKTAERFSFRVPSLLNVANTGPYFHNGVALTLEDAVRHKQTGEGIVRPSTQNLVAGIDYQAVSDAIQSAFDQSPAKGLLPKQLSNEQVADLVAFLQSLSDVCVTDASCIKAFAKDVIASPRSQKSTRQDQVAEQVQSQPRASKPNAVPDLSCEQQKQQASPGASQGFSAHGVDLGINHKRKIGLVKKGWLIDVVNYASVSAVDMNYDCLDDLLFDAGAEGLVLYYQQQDGSYQQAPVPYQMQAGAVNALPMDLDGDYRYDVFVGNYGQGSAAVVFDFEQRADDVAQLSSLSGPVINATAGDLDSNGSPDLVLGMWRSFSSMKQPHIWYNDGQGNLSAEQGFISLRQHKQHVAGGEHIKRKAKVDIGVSDLTFTPNLVDINADSQQDLLLASDFFRSQVLKNQNGRFTDITDKTVIDETNGMGAAIGDFDNNGTMDWFITSIVDKTAPGLTRGHRLYMNAGEGKFQQAPIVNKEVEWSWGACTADFNNDGYLDIFYISGYGEPLPTAAYESEPQKQASQNFLQALTKYSQSRPTLLINDGKANFQDQSQQYGFTQPLDGRGVACFDYQQDGDIDIVVTPLEGNPVLYKNNQATKQNWFAMRFVGLPGNTEAFGTQVVVHTQAGKQYRQVRMENNFVSRNPAQLHFGLGNEDKIDKVEITLPAPHRKTIELTDLALNRLHVLYLRDLLN